MPAAMNTVVRRLIGMMNLFFQYQGRLVNMIKVLSKAQVDKNEVELTQFLDKVVHLSKEILQFKQMIEPTKYL